MHPLNGALLGPYVTVQVTRGALVEHRCILMSRLASENCSTAGLLFCSQGPSGTILLTPYWMGWDFNITLRGGQCFFIGLSCSVPTIVFYYFSISLFSVYKVVYGQEPPSGESTTTECGFKYQLLAVITEVAQWRAPSCSQPQPATDNGVRDGRFNWLVAPPTLHRAVPPELHVLHIAMRAANHKNCCTESAANLRLQNARPTHCRCGHSGYKSVGIVVLGSSDWMGVHHSL